MHRYMVFFFYFISNSLESSHRTEENKMVKLRKIGLKIISLNLEERNAIFISDFLN